MLDSPSIFDNLPQYKTKPNALSVAAGPLSGFTCVHWGPIMLFKRLVPMKADDADRLRPRSDIALRTKRSQRPHLPVLVPYKTKPTASTRPSRITKRTHHELQNEPSAPAFCQIPDPANGSADSLEPAGPNRGRPRSGHSVYRCAPIRAFSRAYACRCARSACSISNSISARAALTPRLLELELTLIRKAVDDPIF